MAREAVSTKIFSALMAKFSVIIPVYNAASTLPETLQSLVNQSNKDFEVVFVDDGSTDDSVKIIQQNLADLPPAIIHRQKNMGLGQARNKAAQLAQGEWLVFLDADDAWAPNKIAVLERSISHYPDVPFLYHPVFEKYPNGMLRPRAFWPVMGFNDFIEKGNPLVPSAVAVQRNLFLQLGGFSENRNEVEDLALWFKLFQAGVAMQHLSERLTIYRVGFGISASIENHLQKVSNAVKSGEEKGWLSQDQAHVFLVRKQYEAARHWHKLGAFKKALEIYNALNKKSMKQVFLLNMARLGFKV